MTGFMKKQSPEWSNPTHFKSYPSTSLSDSAWSGWVAMLPFYWRLVLFLVNLSALDSRLSLEKNLIWSVNNQSLGLPGLVYVKGDPVDVLRSPRTPEVLSVESGKSLIPSLTSDFHAGKLYYMEVNSLSIFELDVNTSSSVPIHRGFGRSRQLAVDWSNRNLYWVDHLFQWIAVKSLMNDDLYDFKVLIEFEWEKPFGIAVDPIRKILYWIESGNNVMIKRAYLDGESPQVIAVGGIYKPRTITTDVKTGRIYWADKFKKSIEYCESDGQHRAILRRINISGFYSVALYKTLVFLTDQKNKQIIVLRDGTGRALASIKPTYGQTYGITVYAEEKQPKLPDYCENQGCDHFCVTGSTSAARCLCQDGFTLSLDNRSCTDSTVYSPRLLSFANKTHVCFVNITAPLTGLTGPPYCPVSDGVDITAIVPDAGRRHLYYADRGRGRISRVSLVDGLSRVVIKDAGQVEGLSFDWIRRTIFWTDSSVKQIKSYDIGTTRRMATVKNTNDSLGHVTVDPFTRQIFWITRSPYAIKSTSYDNTKRETTLISAYISRPSDIYFDAEKQSLIWSDQDQIHRIFVNGTGRKSVLRRVGDINHGLVVYKSMVFWASSRSGNYLNVEYIIGQVFNSRIFIDSPTPFVDVDIVSSLSQQIIRGVCFQNGGCDHYCLPTGGATRECHCELGYELHSDGRTCVTEFLSEDHFLLTDFVGQRFYQVEINTGKIWGTFRPNAFSTALAVDPENKKVFWSDYLRKEIRSSYLNGSQATTLITTGPEHAGRLAVDSVTGNIFYSAFNQAKGNHTRSYIAVVSADGQSRRMIVFGLNSPRAVALHPGQGVIFWSDYGPRPVIERANMDGSQRVPIITTDITQPNGIAIDLKTNQLFWVDGVRHTIERCSFHGMDRQKLLHDPFAQPMQIVLYGDKLYYTGWNKRGIIVMDKADGGNRRYLMESAIFAELSDFVVVWSNMQEKVTNMCSENNGGCSSFCLPTPTGRTCACTDRVLLQTDDRTCIGDNPRSIKALSQESSTDLLPALSASSPETKTDSSDKTGKIVIIAASISAGVVVVVVSIVLVVAIVILRRWRASLPEVAVGYSPHTSRSTVTSSSANPSTTDDIRTNIPSVSVSSPMSVLNRSPCRTQPANQRADLSYLTPCFSNEYASPDEYYNDDDAKLD